MWKSGRIGVLQIATSEDGEELHTQVQLFRSRNRFTYTVNKDGKGQGDTEQVFGDITHLQRTPESASSGADALRCVYQRVRYSPSLRDHCDSRTCRNILTFWLSQKPELGDNSGG